MDEEPITNPFDEDETKGRQTIIWALLGIIVIGCGFLFAGAFFLFQPDARPLYAQYFPSPTATNTRTPTSTPTSTSTPTKTFTPTATVTSTPDYLLTAISQGNLIIEDDFETNDNDWQGFYPNNTVAVKNGSLSLAGNRKGYIGIAYCTFCPPSGNSYYLEAEVTSESNTSTNYGLAFCFDRNYSDYYVFQINSTSKWFDLYKHTDADWEGLAYNKYAYAKEDFPSPNKLGVHFDHGTINLYINNSLVYSYVDKKPISCVQYGFFTSSGDKIFADNLILYDAQIAP